MEKHFDPPALWLCLVKFRQKVVDGRIRDIGVSLELEVANMYVAHVPSMQGCNVEECTEPIFITLCDVQAKDPQQVSCLKPPLGILIHAMATSSPSPSESDNNKIHPLVALKRRIAALEEENADLRVHGLPGKKVVN